MTRTTNQPPTATNARGSYDEQDRQGEDGRLGDNDERRENLSAVRDEQDNERNDSRDNRDERRDVYGRDERFGEDRERRDRGEYAEQDARPEQQQAPAAGMDVIAPVLEAWKQVFTSWSELAEAMLKVQQDAFASMIGGANAYAKDIRLGDHRKGELAYSGSRTTASTPDRIEHDRR